MIDKYSTLIIELTNFCNLNCKMCPVIRRKPEFMKFKTFKKIISQVKEAELSFNVMLPFWRGESLLHPEFKKIMEFFSFENKNNLIANGVAVDTNGMLLDNSTCSFISGTGIFSVITISCDAFLKESYEKIRCGGKKSKLEKSVKLLLEKRKHKMNSLPHIVLQYIVMEENYEELPQFISYWKQVFNKKGMKLNLKYDYNKPSEAQAGDSIFIRRCLFPYNKKKQSRYDEIFKKTVKKFFNNPDYSFLSEPVICSGPFTHITVGVNGDVFPCCVDTGGEAKVGNIHNMKISDIINGREFLNYKKKHINRQKSTLKACRKCMGQVYPKFCQEELDFLKKLI
ncbi:MAG: radical SAM/SPASM domain-containing protein [Candidatus Muiribacteriota bacterium]